METRSGRPSGPIRDRDRDPQRAADRLVLAEQDVKHDAVDLVVHAVVGQHPDDLGGLAVAVDSALTLFVAGRVPGEVVVDDRVEVVLEVDPLGQAVSADQHALRGLGELEHPLLALRGGQRPGDGLDLDPLREPGAQLAGR